MHRDFITQENSRKLQIERRALLKQLGGYTYQGSEVLYSTTGLEHLEAVTKRKERSARIEAGARSDSL